MNTDLTGCFASDGRIHPDLRSASFALPRSLPDALFRSPPEIAAGSGQVLSTTSDEELLPRLDEILDKYRIDQEIGRGGFAVVYRATHLLMRTTVAIKLLFPRMLAKHPQLAQGMCDEARMTSLIDHPNVVRVLDVTSTPRYTFIVMEHIEGLSLRRAIARKPLDPANVLKIGIQLCGGLRAAGDQGLIHRDIKPGNILITRAGLAKLVDFGLAQRADDLRRGSDGSSSSNRKRIAGTPAYIAPEQATTPDLADHRSDIYALGATLYDAAVGRPPFEGGTTMQTLLAHINTPPTPPIELRPDLPPGLSEILLRMLAKRPEERPQSYDELSDELMRVYRGLRTQTTTIINNAAPGQPKPALLGKLRGLFTPKT